MLNATTHTLAKLLKTDCPLDVEFSGVFTDTRKRMDGGVFLALIGDNFNAHHYAKKAQKMGAVAIIASEKITSELPVLLVKNTQHALDAISQYHLNNIKPITIAITGSNGKTTTKNLLANILNLIAPTLKTQGNLNNHLGVPMTLLTLETRHEYAVIEMGANHLGEIAHLRRLVKPDVAVVVNTNDAHLGEFGGKANLINAKGEIYAKKSQNIVNTQTLFKGDISFGAGGEVFASHINPSNWTLNIGAQKIEVKLQLIGVHNIENALAASACAFALGVKIEVIKAGLEATTAQAGRLNIIRTDYFTLIDDTYNASPESMRAAINTLLTFQGEKIAVLGSMGELGELSEKFHQQIGQFAKQSLDKVYTFGELGKNYGGVNFNNLEQLAAHIRQNHAGSSILIKGSRLAKLEKLVILLQK
jgi:UDP-N-acetylmuramoyl-tripeptide--D-alanyl-D-alanine ligase